jgi:hypothetical protein
MTMPEVIVTPVPEGQGFLPMTLPTAPKSRFDPSEIVLDNAKESDLEAIVPKPLHLISIQLTNCRQAIGLHASFPEKFWWGMFEPTSIRAPDPIRVARYVARMRPLLAHGKDFTFLVARLAATGEVAGAAGWHHPTATGSGPNMWGYDYPNGPVSISENEVVGFESGYPWKEGEREEAWKDVLAENLAKVWGPYEKIRKEETEGKPHWYVKHDIPRVSLTTIFTN